MSQFMGQETVSQVIASEIRAELQRQDMSLRELADRLGWAKSSTHRRVQGTQRLTADDVDAIAKVLGVAPASFFYGDAA